MTRCVHCDELIDTAAQAHQAHEPGCPTDPDATDFTCGCDQYAHPRCCRAPHCRVTTGLGRADLPVASTRGLPVKRHP